MTQPNVAQYQVKQMNQLTGKSGGLLSARRDGAPIPVGVRVA